MIPTSGAIGEGAGIAFLVAIPSNQVNDSYFAYYPQGLQKYNIVAIPSNQVNDSYKGDRVTVTNGEFESQSLLIRSMIPTSPYGGIMELEDKSRNPF